MRANLAAWTDPEQAIGAKVVQYVSINQDRLDEVELTVRNGDGVQVTVFVPVNEFRRMARDAYAATSGHDP